MQDTVFLLEHAYEINDEDEVKFIGIFSSVKEAKSAIIQLITQPGFKEFGADCFKIAECKLDAYEWKEGFSNWRDMNETT